MTRPELPPRSDALLESRKPCGAWNPLWTNMPCNLAVGHPGNHERHEWDRGDGTDHELVNSWPAGQIESRVGFPARTSGVLAGCRQVSSPDEDVRGKAVPTEAGTGFSVSVGDGYYGDATAAELIEEAARLEGRLVARDRAWKWVLT